MTTAQVTVAADIDRLCPDTIRMLSIDVVQRANSRGRASLDAASTRGWHRRVRELGEPIRTQSFGASGPAGALDTHVGLTPERVAAPGRRAIRRADAKEGR